MAQQKDFALYSYFRSSASYRARIALNLKGLDFDYRAVHLLNNGGEQLQDQYSKLNPSREVPTLVHKTPKGEVVVAQSMAIIDYLDRVHPTPPLFPTEAPKRALVIQACEIVNSGIQPLHNLRVLKELEKNFGANEDQKNAWTAHWIQYGLQSLESLLRPHASQFSIGDSPTAADCFLIPNLANADRFKVSLEPYPTLKHIRSVCDKLEAFAKAAPSAQPDSPK